MSAIVGVWMDEIEKLKAQARGALLWRAKKEQRSAKGRRVEEEEEASKETTMSETTLCLLMDRFVPC
ncbi:hypothetical protein GQ457_03G000350 [Hibiscus cannabinus]